MPVAQKNGADEGVYRPQAKAWFWLARHARSRSYATLTRRQRLIFRAEGSTCCANAIIAVNHSITTKNNCYP